MLKIKLTSQQQNKLITKRIKTQKKQETYLRLLNLSERKKTKRINTLQEEIYGVINKFSLRNSQSSCQQSVLKKIIYANQKQRKQLFKNIALKKNKEKEKNEKKSHKFQKQNTNIFIRRSNIQNFNNYQQKLSKRESSLLKMSFNRRIQQIKLRKYFNSKDEVETPKILFQAYGATLTGEKHSENQDSTYFSDGLYILCDGHGANGKQISNFVSESLHNSISKTLEEHRVDQIILRQLFNKIDIELDNSNFDISFSGCTCVAVLRFQNNIICASLGDSKAYVFKGFSSHQISITHKPDKQTQAKRIQNYGGVIRQIQFSKDKFVGPMRIWAPGKNSWGPGLALSRAFGDKASRKYGIISIPDIKTFKITSQEQFLVIGSDGLFDFFNEQDIYIFIKRCLRDDRIRRQDICHLLVQEAKNKWPQGQSDDISCILIFM